MAAFPFACRGSGPPPHCCAKYSKKSSLGFVVRDHEMADTGEVNCALFLRVLQIRLQSFRRLQRVGYADVTLLGTPCGLARSAHIPGPDLKPSQKSDRSCPNCRALDCTAEILMRPSTRWGARPQRLAQRAWGPALADVPAATRILQWRGKTDAVTLKAIAPFLNLLLLKHRPRSHVDRADPLGPRSPAESQSPPHPVANSARRVGNWWPGCAVEEINTQ